MEDFGDSAIRRERMKDARMVERAIRENWPIKDEDRAPLMARMMEMAMSPESSPREAVAACKAVLAGSQLNLESVSVWLRAEDQLAIKARLEALEANQGGPDVVERPDRPA
jgi:hypothetical protein